MAMAYTFALIHSYSQHRTRGILQQNKKTKHQTQNRIQITYSRNHSYVTIHIQLQIEQNWREKKNGTETEKNQLFPYCEHDTFLIGHRIKIKSR